jgi:hypothetical protein
MNRRTLLPALCLLLVALLPSCRSAQDPSARGSGDSGAIVVFGRDLPTSQVLLDALANRVPTMQVVRPTGSCPIVHVRGQAQRARGGAAVYVDGTRMRDTCVLLQLRPGDIERVELYPVSGGRPGGYTAGPGGLILVFRIVG